jgi:hypothetical protein
LAAGEISPTRPPLLLAPSRVCLRRWMNTPGCGWRSDSSSTPRSTPCPTSGAG